MHPSLCALTCVSASRSTLMNDEEINKQHFPHQLVHIRWTAIKLTTSVSCRSPSPEMSGRSKNRSSQLGIGSHVSNIGLPGVNSESSSLDQRTVNPMLWAAS